MRELPIDIVKKAQELQELCKIRGYEVKFDFTKVEVDFWDLLNNKIRNERKPLRNEDINPYAK